MRGTRCSASCRPRTSAVHPRVCGEHVARRMTGCAKTGSSPRVRGTPPLFPILAWRYRFIPACAGNTGPRGRSRGRSPVHPRVCGEHGTPPPRGCSRSGSSPRVRGTRRWRCGAGAAGRFIPACAGNTNATRPLRRMSPVHPRVCGEHPCRRWQGNRLLRFIPACAGNTWTMTEPPRGQPVHPRVCGEHLAAPNAKHTRPRFIPACAGNTPT